MGSTVAADPYPPESGPLASRCILVAEDDSFIKSDIVATLQAEGATEIHECARLQAAMALIQSGRRIDVALLDLQLADELIYPAADALIARGVRVVFLSGYDRSELPECYASCQFLAKPVSIQALLAALLSDGSVTRPQPTLG